MMMIVVDIVIVYDDDTNKDDIYRFWFDFSFTALQHILGHFGRGQLT